MASDLAERNKELQAMIRTATAETAAVQRDRDALRAEQNKRLETVSRYQEAMKPGTKIQVDLAGGGIALVSSELLSWGVRWAADWSKTGWWARNQDYLQAAPHIALGTLIYVAEVCSSDKKGKKLPEKWEMIFTEAGKLLAYTGFSNLAKAVRYRVEKGKTMAEDNAALRAELDALKASQKAS